MMDEVVAYFRYFPNIFLWELRITTLKFNQPILGQRSALGPPNTVTIGILGETPLGGDGGSGD
jgi:hypothetical protein